MMKPFFHRSLLCALLLALAAVARAQGQTATAIEAGTATLPTSPDAANSAQSTNSECKTCRWLELKTATISTRYLFSDNSQGQVNAKQNQHQEAVEGRFKFDGEGKFSIHFGLFSGDNFSGGWNDTGWGRGEGSAKLYLKQFYFAAKPVKGVEFQYGSLGVMNGQSTAITGYADDGYVMGQRVVVERPKELFFDQIAVTYAYLGDYFAPNVNKRYHRLKESNYHQFLVSKNIGRRATVSADYTFQNGAETVREAVSVNTKELRVIDSFRFENYQRTDVNAAYGFAVAGQKRLFDRVNVGGGFAQVDRHFGGYNADAFFDGRRVFLSAEVELTPEFSVSTLFNRAVGNDYAVGNRTHFDVAFHYNVLRGLKRAGIF